MKSKDAYYFSHDTNAKSDPKIMAMRNAYGPAGYGWYWIIIETMAEQSNYKLMHKKWVSHALAMAMQCEATKTEEFIKSCIEEFELFESDGEYFWSNRLLRTMSNVNETRKVRSEAGKKGAEARWKGDEKPLQNDSKGIANAKQTDAVAMAKNSKGKESKVKERKENNNFVNNTESERDIKHTETDIGGSAGKISAGSASAGYDADIQKFLRGFKNRFSVSFSREDISALRNSVTKHWKNIEIEFYSLEIFLRTILQRMEDINSARKIHNPISFFFSGAFGENRYLWDRTAKEESNGPGYNKEMINAALASENVGMSAGLKAMV